MTTTLLKKELDNIQNLQNSDDFFQAICELSELFKSLGIKDLKKIIREEIHIQFIENVFSNPYFNEALITILEKEKELFNSNEYKELNKACIAEKKKELNFSEKQFIQTAIYLAAFALSNTFEYLSKDEIIYLRKKLLLAIETTRKSQNEIYTLTDICFVMYDTVSELDFSFQKEMSKKYGFKYIFGCNKISRRLIGAMMLIIPEINVFQLKFKKIIKQKKTEENFSVLHGLCEIYNISRKIKGGLEYFINNEKNIHNFVNCFITNNERNILYIFEDITKGFHAQENKKFADIILQKIGNAEKIRKNLLNFSKENLYAFSGVANDKDEWSNKIYLISNKLLTTMETIDSSPDVGWKIKVVIYELSNWIDDAHQIVNKYDIEDDWDKIERLIIQENSKIEWKSTFWTPTEELIIDEQREKKRGKDILFNIANAMLGMMNTDGGIVIVGLVENPQSIKRDDVKRNLLIKNNFTFFDINYEFQQKRKNIDNAKREIQDMLFKETQYTADKFNNLWSMEQVEIKNNYSVATIYKIEIKKSDNYIYSVKKEKDVLWTTLIKRADGRTIRVDPREYFNKGSVNLT